MAKIHTISMSSKAIAELVAWLGLISVAISPEYLISQTAVASDLVSNISSIHKLVVVLALLPYALFFGLREKVNPIIVAYLIVLLMTFTLATWPADLQVSQAFRAFTSFVLGWFVFSLNWQRQLAHKYLLSISLMPIASVAGGAMLS